MTADHAGKPSISLLAVVGTLFGLVTAPLGAFLGLIAGGNFALFCSQIFISPGVEPGIVATYLYAVSTTMGVIVGAVVIGGGAAMAGFCLVSLVGGHRPGAWIDAFRSRR